MQGNETFDVRSIDSDDAKVAQEYDPAEFTSANNNNLVGFEEDEFHDQYRTMTRHRKSSFAIGSRSQMKRTLTLVGAVTFIVGTTVGSGIFASPGLVLLHTHSAGLALVAWVLAGIIALMGGCTYAELGTAIPESGGEYPYIFRTYGHLCAFLFSWPGGLAIASIVCAQYLVKPFYLTHDPSAWLSKGVGLVILWIAIAINALDVEAAEGVLKYLTYLKGVTIGMTAVIGFVFMAKDSPTSPTHINLQESFKGADWSFGDFAVAVIICLWTYDGWNSLNFVTEELVDPAKNMPRALLIAIPTIIVCYILANIAFFAVLQQDEMADYQTKQAVSGFAVVFGNYAMKKFGEVIYSILIAMSAFGALDGGCFVGSRVVYASAKRGDFPKTFQTLYGHKSPSPLRALVFEGSVATILITTTNFEELVNYFCVASWIFYFLAASCVPVLRWREPELERPFRVWLPIPVTFCIIAAALVVATIIQQAVPSLIAIGCIAAGVPFYFLEGHVHDLAVGLCCPQIYHRFHHRMPEVSHHRLSTEPLEEDEVNGDENQLVNEEGSRL